jgi:hypothetical protein
VLRTAVKTNGGGGGRRGGSMDPTVVTAEWMMSSCPLVLCFSYFNELVKSLKIDTLYLNITNVVILLFLVNGF